MPTKKLKVQARDDDGELVFDDKGKAVMVDTGRVYEIANKGRRFVWHADVWEDEGETPFDVTIPLRLKLAVVYEMADREMDAAAMRDLLAEVIPNQAEALGNMDMGDFQAMFTTWQSEYNALTGATPGE